MKRERLYLHLRPCVLEPLHMLVTHRVQINQSSNQCMLNNQYADIQSMINGFCKYNLWIYRMKRERFDLNTRPCNLEQELRSVGTPKLYIFVPHREQINQSMYVEHSNADIKTVKDQWVSQV